MDFVNFFLNSFYKTEFQPVKPVWFLQQGYNSTFSRMEIWWKSYLPNQILSQNREYLCLGLPLFTALLIASSISIAFYQKKASASSDEAAIKEVIEQNPHFLGRDFKSWEALWVHEPTPSGLLLQYWCSSVQWMGMPGKNKLENHLFAESRKLYQWRCKKHNFSFRIYGNGA